MDLKELKRILVPLPKQQKRKTPEPPAATAGAGEQQPDQLAADEQQQPVEEQQPQPVEEAQGPSTAAGPSKRQVGGTDQQQAAVLSSSKGLTEQLRGVVDEVAAGSIALVGLLCWGVLALGGGGFGPVTFCYLCACTGSLPAPHALTASFCRTLLVPTPTGAQCSAVPRQPEAGRRSAALARRGLR